eukprot:jgi/Picre1/30178/NNA_005547.t1
MEESGSDVGGLQIMKRPGDKEEQEDKHTFRAPEPRRSILGLDKLAAQKRREKQQKQAGERDADEERGARRRDGGGYSSSRYKRRYDDGRRPSSSSWQDTPSRGGERRESRRPSHYSSSWDAPSASHHVSRPGSRLQRRDVRDTGRVRFEDEDGRNRYQVDDRRREPAVDYAELEAIEEQLDREWYAQEEGGLWTKAMIRSWVMLRMTIACAAERDCSEEIDQEGRKVLLLVHDTRPPFLDGRFLFTKQKGPVMPLKDPTSDLAVIARNGSKIVKEIREKKDANKSRARFWEELAQKLVKSLD